MEIPIFDTSERERVIEVTGSAEEMVIQTEDFTLQDDVRVSCTLHLNGDLLKVEGVATATMTAQCARCLETFPMEVSGQFLFVVMRLTLGMAIPEGEDEAGEGDREFIYVQHDATSLDITDFVRDAIILSLPMRVLCGEDCKGLCGVCGNNRNERECGCASGATDPRWQALGGIISDKRKQ